MKFTQADISDILPTLTEREQFVIIHRFGLDHKGSRTLRELGEELGCTKNTVMRAEQKALRKLRHPTRSRRLTDLAREYGIDAFRVRKPRASADIWGKRERIGVFHYTREEIQKAMIHMLETTLGFMYPPPVKEGTNDH